MSSTASDARRSGVRWFLLALLVYCLVAASLTGPALLGKGSLIAEGWIDRDPVYTPAGERARMRPYIDAAPAMIEIARDGAFAAGLWQGRIDVWNSWSGAGAPLWAEQGGPFFPTRFASYLFPHHVTFMLALALRLVVAAVGMFYLARAVGLPPAIALFTGALFEYSGIMIAELAFSAFSPTYMLPWVLLSARKLSTEGGPGAIGFGALALGITALGGQPSLILVVFIGFGLWLLGEWARQRPPLKKLATDVRLVVAAGVLAFLIAAVALLPFLELAWHGHTYKQTDTSETLWYQFLGMTRDVFAPALFLPSLISAARDTMPDHYWPWAAGASIGLVGLLLAVAGVEKLREQWGLLLVAIVGLGLTLSPPGLAWLHAVPVVSFIVPWYCYPLVVAPLCLAAGFGLWTISATSRRSLMLAPLALVLLGIVFFWLVLFGGFDALAGLRKEIVDSALYTEVFSDDLRRLNALRILISPVAGIVAVSAYVLLCRARPAQAAAILAVLALAEAAVIRIPTVIFERSVALATTPSQARTRLHGLLAGGSWRFIGLPPLRAAQPNTGLLFELRDLRSGSALAVRRHSKYLDLAGPQSEDPWKRPEWQYPVAVKLPMLSLAAVKYLVYTTLYRESADIPSDLREMATIGGVVFFENPFALPRFRITHDVIPADDERQAFDTLLRLLDDTRPGASAKWPPPTVIEGLSPDEAQQVRGRADTRHSLDSVRLISEPDMQTIVLEANLDSAGFVLIADTYYPGWRATVDGVSAPIRPANLLFRAVYVPAGRHTIEMKYKSTWLLPGAILTLLGLSLTAALIARKRRDLK